MGHKGNKGYKVWGIRLNRYKSGLTYVSSPTYIQLGAMRWALMPPGWLYGGVMWLRNVLYDKGIFSSWQAPVPVISVGNLSTGGTGKTPIAAFLLSYFSHKHIRVAYLSRGYGRKTKGYHLVQPEAGGAEVFGDEACQIASGFPNLPVAVCENRRIGIQRLVVEEGAALIVLDDAFQHRKVKRELDIVVMDANRPFWRDAVLPAGRLREPIRGLRRGSVFVVNKVETERQITEHQARLAHLQGPILYSQPVFGSIRWFNQHASIPSPNLEGLPVIAFAGIGNPQYFLQQLIQAGAHVERQRFFRDHHIYQPREIRNLVSQLRELPEDGVLLTTEKDFYRLRGLEWMEEFAGVRLAYVPLELRWLVQGAVNGSESVHRQGEGNRDSGAWGALEADEIRNGSESVPEPGEKESVPEQLRELLDGLIG